MERRVKEIRLSHLQQEPSGKGNRSVVAFQISGKASHFFLGLLYFPNKEGLLKRALLIHGAHWVELKACRDTDLELLEAAILFSSHISCSWFSSHVSFPPHPSWVYLNIFLAFKPTEGLVFFLNGGAMSLNILWDGKSTPLPGFAEQIMEEPVAKAVASLLWEESNIF